MTGSVNDALYAYEIHVKKMTASFDMPVAPADKIWVSAKIRHMVEVDQYSRKYYDAVLETSTWDDGEKREFHHQFSNRIRSMDARHTTDLKSLTKIWGWFKISDFGEAVAHDAWLLAQHADDDTAFQKEVLEKLEGLYPNGEASASSYAYLFDRVARKEASQLQRYGTQVVYIDGLPGIAPVEDPEQLDTRREAVGLEPIADYLKKFKPT